MADPSRPPTYTNYGTKAVCAGCGRKLTYDTPGGLWFVGAGNGHPGLVFGFNCCSREAAKA